VIRLHFQESHFQPNRKEWLDVLRKTSQVFNLANAISNLYSMDRGKKRLLGGMVFAKLRL